MTPFRKIVELALRCTLSSSDGSVDTLTVEKRSQTVWGGSRAIGGASCCLSERNADSLPQICHRHSRTH